MSIYIIAINVPRQWLYRCSKKKHKKKHSVNYTAPSAIFPDSVTLGSSQSMSNGNVL